MTTLIETTDVDAAYHTMSTIYGIRRFAAGGRPFMRIDRDQLGPAELHSLVFTMECDVDGGPLGALYLGHVADGTIRYRCDGGWESPVYGPGDVFLAVQPDIPWHGDIVTAHLEFASLDLPLLAQVADAAPGRLAEPIRFTGYQPATAQDARLWLNAYRFVRDHVRTTPPADQPLVTGAAARLLAATALSVFPNNALADPTSQDRRDGHPATLRRAISFIDDNAGRDISAADIAAAACVSIRALQLAFRRHLDCTPTEYVRRVRLEQAHRQLVAADPERESVTAVAYRWGFASPSRFAVYYRRAYGVLPGHTLRH